MNIIQCSTCFYCRQSQQEEVFFCCRFPPIFTTNGTQFPVLWNADKQGCGEYEYGSDLFRPNDMWWPEQYKEEEERRDKELALKYKRKAEKEEERKNNPRWWRRKKR